ncbi:MAG: NAD(+) synthase, partial [Candidatus Paceibacterota bacterium]
FARESEILISDIDLEHIVTDRNKTNSFDGVTAESTSAFRTIEVPLLSKNASDQKLLRKILPHPFLPDDKSVRDNVCKEIFSIQSSALAKRIESSNIDKLVLGISGGLDSTLALLVSVKALELLGKPVKNVLAFSLPGFGTTSRTKNNAEKLCEALGVSFEEINISKTVLDHFKDIGHNPNITDVTYENSQARYRTMILMDKANQNHAIVVGTGDLSEIALGWCTFNGDHISQYGVNSGVPKTLVKYLVSWVAETEQKRTKAQKILEDIVDTPVSPELVKKGKEISQKTEEIIGPYELHDFFLYHLIRWGSSPSKIFFLAKKSFAEKYSDKTILKWLTLFLKRFFENQWKRSVMPDGPKVGSVALSPRGDWRMPSDADKTIWIEDL